MKAAFALISLLPLLAAASPQPVYPRELPTVDLATLNEGEYHGSAARVGKSVMTPGDKLCPAGYPFVCNGRCCPFNLCCEKQCCTINTDFCGADGHCYIYDTSVKGFAGSEAT